VIGEVGGGLRHVAAVAGRADAAAFVGECHVATDTRGTAATSLSTRPSPATCRWAPPTRLLRPSVLGSHGRARRR
jgi:hypothetical protein